MKNILNTIDWTIEIVLCVIAIAVCVSFGIDTANNIDSSTNTTVINSEIEKIESNLGNPEDWHILKVNEDYSEALVLMKNGEIHLYTVYFADEETIRIAHNGQLYSFFLPAP